MVRYSCLFNQPCYLNRRSYFYGLLIREQRREKQNGMINAIKTISYSLQICARIYKSRNIFYPAQTKRDPTNLIWDNIFRICSAIPASLYLFKANNGNTTTICESCSKLTPERRHGFVYHSRHQLRVWHLGIGAAVHL